MSKYQELASMLRAAIENNTYTAGDRLPTTPELCEMYHVSNTTVKKAMDALEQQGLVARRRGSGIYVKNASKVRSTLLSAFSTSGQMTGLTAEFEGTEVTVSSQVNSFSIEHPSPEVAEALEMQAEEFVYAICRTRLTNDKPRSVEYTYMPINLVPGLLEKHLSGSIYHYLEHDLGLNIDSAHRVLRAVLPTTDECAWLKIASGDPLLEVKQVAYLDDGTPFEYSTTRHTSDYEFYVISTH